MQRVIPITGLFSVTGALDAADFAQAAALGFKSVISNLPDGESPRHPGSTQAKDLAAAAGLAYRHIPATKFDVLSPRVVDATYAAAADLPPPILAHCASGMRSAVAWAGAAARGQDAARVIAALARAGFNLAPLADELVALRSQTATEVPTPLRVDAAE